MPPVPCRSRRHAAVGVVVALVVLGIPAGFALSSSHSLSSADGPSVDSSGPSEPAPAGYTIGVAYDWSSPDGYGDERAAVVTAALKEAERRSGTRLSVKAVPVQDYGQTPATRMLTAHPGMLALIGDTSSVDGVQTEFDQIMTTIDTCKGTAGPEFDYSTIPGEFEVGKQEGRYLSAAYGVDKVLVGSDYHWDDKTPDSSLFDANLGHGLREAGVQAVEAAGYPDEMGEGAVARDVGAQRPDAVTLPGSRHQEGWVDALKKSGQLMVVQDQYEASCDNEGDLEYSDRYDDLVPVGTLRFRTFHDERQKDADCDLLPKVCTDSPELRKMFEARGAVELYDGTLALAEGLRLLKEGGGLTDAESARGTLRKTMETVDTEGLLGRYRFKEHQARDRPVWVDVRENGRWKQLGTVGSLTGKG